MIHKEFIDHLSGQVEMTRGRTSRHARQLIDLMRVTLKSDSLAIRGFGKFTLEDGRPRFAADNKLLGEIKPK